MGPALRVAGDAFGDPLGKVYFDAILLTDVTVDRDGAKHRVLGARAVGCRFGRDRVLCRVPLIFDLLTRLTALATTVALLLSKWFHCDTLSRRQKTLAVNIPHRGAQGPLHLLIDSAAINVEGEGEWDARKHGGQKRRV